MEVRPDPTTTTTAEQRAAAIEWLDRTGPYAHWAPFTHDSAAARDTIKALLAKPSQGTSDPVLPAHPTPGLLKAMADAFRKSEEDKLEDDMRLVHAATHAHLSFKPGKTKEVDVWRVEYARRGEVGTEEWLPVTRTFMNENSAREIAKDIDAPALHRCIRVTGPHKQIVPA